MADELEGIFRGLPERGRAPQTFKLGDMVRIKTGAFAAFTGRIDGINQSKHLLKVRVEIFGRETQLKLGYAEVEKLSLK